jgi:hypothetical protein
MNFLLHFLIHFSSILSQILYTLLQWRGFLRLSIFWTMITYLLELLVALVFMILVIHYTVFYRIALHLFSTFLPRSLSYPPYFPLLPRRHLFYFPPRSPLHLPPPTITPQTSATADTCSPTPTYNLVNLLPPGQGQDLLSYYSSCVGNVIQLCRYIIDVVIV